MPNYQLTHVKLAGMDVISLTFQLAKGILGCNWAQRREKRIPRKLFISRSQFSNVSNGLAALATVQYARPLRCLGCVQERRYSLVQDK